MPGIRRCLNCGSDKTYFHKGKYPQWNKHKDGYLCHKCASKLWRKNNPSKVKELNGKNNLKWNSIYGPRHLKYKDKIILLKENPRTGVCSICKRKVGEGIKETQIHHFAEYHDEDPLRDTIELCVACHNKEHWLLGTYTHNQYARYTTPQNNFLKY